MSDTNNYRLIPSYDENNNETGYYTREPDGLSGMTVSALAAFVGTSQPVITNLLNRIRDSSPISNDLPESLKVLSGKDLRLISNDLQGRRIIPDEACQAIVEYYAFDARSYEGQELAKANYRAASRAGIRVFIWVQTGYVPEPFRESLRSNTTVYIERLENIRDHQIADDRWSTFREGAEVLLLVEKEMGVPIDQLDLCDGSIGSHWSRYRQGKPWAGTVGQYKHVFRDDRRIQFPNAYELSELSYFRQWLRDLYIPYHLPEYIANKYGKLAAKDIYERIGDSSPRVQEVIKISRITPKQLELYESYQRARQQLLRTSSNQDLLDQQEDE